MENKNLAIALTFATILLCGRPGLMSVGISVLVVVDGPFPDRPEAEWLLGFILLCSGTFFIIIPVVVGIFSLRRKTAEKPRLSQDEPIQHRIRLSRNLLVGINQFEDILHLT